MSTKRKLNVVDIIIIFITIAIILAVGILLLGKFDTDPKDKTYSKTVVLEVLQKSEDFCEFPQKGDKLFSAETQNEIGILKAKEIKPSMMDTTSIEEGKMLKTPVPNKYDLLLTIEITNPNLISNIGSSLYINSKTYIVSGYVVDIIKDNKEESK